MIHLDQNSAALFAQVLPVLTLVLLLEGRVPVKRHKTAMIALAIELFRFVCMLYGMAGTLICMWIVASKEDPDRLTDWLITVGFWIISIGIVSFGVMICWGPIREAAVGVGSELKNVWKGSDN